MVKAFSITAGGHNIRCLLHCHDQRSIQKIVVFCHGFGSDKGCNSARKFAEKLLSKQKRAAVLSFDLPAHGEDVKKKLSLSDCDAYLSLVLDYVKNQLGVEEIYGCGTSFGGYLTLKYIAQHGNPYRKICLRCPAVPMYQVLTENILTPELWEQLRKGKDVSVGFDKLIRLDLPFLEDLQAADIRKIEFFDYAEDILILHGTADETVPFADVRDFAEANCIEFLPVEKAGHRFRNTAHMDLAIARMLEFMELG